MIPPGGVHGDRNSWTSARALDMTGIANLASGLLPLLCRSRRARISPRVAIPCNLRAHRVTSRPSSFGEAATGARPNPPPERPGRGVHSGPLLPLLVSHAGARFWPFDGDDAVSFPRRWCEPQSRPAPSRPSPPTCWPARRRWGSAAEPSSIHRGSSDVFGVPLFDAAGCLQDDAPVRRASRLRTTSDGVRCVLFDTALTDRERSRQNSSSALWAPLTLRLSPGATSFQHQPTREETQNEHRMVCA
jgi:hypothetical protein